MKTTLQNLEIELAGDLAGGSVPLSVISQKFLNLSPREAVRRASLKTLGLPAYRLGNQKTPYLVMLTDLADLVDRRYQAARTDWEGQAE